MRQGVIGAPHGDGKLEGAGVQVGFTRVPGLVESEASILHVGQAKAEGDGRVRVRQGPDL